MSTRRQELHESEANLDEALSPFRAAFARAREEGASAVEPTQHTSTAELDEVAADENRGRSSDLRPGRFEVRIEKRRGKRSGDTKRWNKLGSKGWQLVAVVGKEAFFRREAPALETSPGHHHAGRR